MSDLDPNGGLGEDDELTRIFSVESRPPEVHVVGQLALDVDAVSEDELVDETVDELVGGGGVAGVSAEWMPDLSDVDDDALWSEELPEDIDPELLAIFGDDPLVDDDVVSSEGVVVSDAGGVPSDVPGDVTAAWSARPGGGVTELRVDEVVVDELPSAELLSAELLSGDGDAVAAVGATGDPASDPAPDADVAVVVVGSGLAPVSAGELDAVDTVAGIDAAAVAASGAVGVAGEVSVGGADSGFDDDAVDLESFLAGSPDEVALRTESAADVTGLLAEPARVSPDPEPGVAGGDGDAAADRFDHHGAKPAPWEPEFASPTAARAVSSVAAAESDIDALFVDEASDSPAAAVVPDAAPPVPDMSSVPDMSPPVPDMSSVPVQAPDEDPAAVFPPAAGIVASPPAKATGPNVRAAMPAPTSTSVAGPAVVPDPGEGPVVGDEPGGPVDAAEKKGRFAGRRSKKAAALVGGLDGGPVDGVDGGVSGPLAGSGGSAGKGKRSFRGRKAAKAAALAEESSLPGSSDPTGAKAAAAAAVAASAAARAAEESEEVPSGPRKVFGIVVGGSKSHGNLRPGQAAAVVDAAPPKVRRPLVIAGVGFVMLGLAVLWIRSVQEAELLRAEATTAVSQVAATEITLKQLEGRVRELSADSELANRVDELQAREAEAVRAFEALASVSDAAAKLSAVSSSSAASLRSCQTAVSAFAGAVSDSSVPEEERDRRAAAVNSECGPAFTAVEDLEAADANYRAAVSDADFGGADEGVDGPASDGEDSGAAGG